MFSIKRLLGHTLNEEQKGTIEDVAAQAHPKNRKALLNAAHLVASADGDVKMNSTEFNAFENDVLSLGATPLDASRDIARAAYGTANKLKAHYDASAALLNTAVFTDARPPEGDRLSGLTDQKPEYPALIRLAENVKNVDPSLLSDGVREAITDQLDAVIESYTKPSRGTYVSGYSSLHYITVVRSLEAIVDAAEAMGSSSAPQLEVTHDTVTESRKAHPGSRRKVTSFHFEFSVKNKEGNA